MITQTILRKIENAAKPYFIGASGCHDWTHVERVRVLALHIGRQEGADLQILEIATLLHDTGRKEEMDKQGKICHAELGTQIAEKILASIKLGSQQRKNILHCIATHRFRRGNAPQTIEAKVLYDADKLDSIGAIGIGRAFLFAGSAGSGNLYTGREQEIAREQKDYCFTKEDSTFLEYEIKLKHIKERMLTVTGRKMAEARDRFMRHYFDQFWQEVKGNK